MSSVMAFVFNAVELCVVTTNEKPWTRAREVCRALEYGRATKAADDVRHLCSKTNYAHRWQLAGLVPKKKPVDWPKDSQKYDIYIYEEGMYEIVFSSQQSRVKDFWRHCCNVLFPHVRQQLTNKSKEDHQQAIEGIHGQHQQAIKGKDAAIALINDNLQGRDNQIQTIKYDNVAP